MTASYKIALAAGATLLLAVVATLIFRGQPTDTALNLGDPAADNLPQPPETPGEADGPAGLPSREAIANAEPPPTRIHYSTEPPLPSRPASEDPAGSLTLGPDPFASGTSIFAGEPDPLGNDPLELDARAGQPRTDDAAAATSAGGTSGGTSGGDSEFIPPLDTDATAAATAGRADRSTRLGPTDPARATPDTPDTPGSEPAPAPEPARPAPVMRSYTIESGDSFSSIALATYGSAERWVEIAHANPLVDPNRLRVGQEIKLPQLPDRPAAAGPPADDDGSVRRGTTYTVRAGDSLSSIAKQFYNAASKWELIYQANRRTIGNNPGNLKLGMELTIPPPDAGAN